MTAYAVLSTLVLLLTGWLAGAESASWALVQPVVAGVLIAFTLTVNVPINKRTLT